MSILHWKSTAFGIILLIIATIYTFAPYKFPDVDYEPNYWLTTALYLASSVFILFEPKDAQNVLKSFIKWMQK